MAAGLIKMMILIAIVATETVEVVVTTDSTLLQHRQHNNIDGDAAAAAARSAVDHARLDATNILTSNHVPTVSGPPPVAMSGEQSRVAQQHHPASAEQHPAAPMLFQQLPAADQQPQHHQQYRQQVPVIHPGNHRPADHMPPPMIGSPPMMPPPMYFPPHQSTHYAPSVSGEFAPDNQLEVQHEFKLTIGPGQEECLFQRAKPQSRFYSSFKVLGSSDGVVDVTVRSPDGNIVDQHLLSREGTTDKFMSVGEGPFSVCILNQHSRFTAQLVHVFIATYVVEQWKKYDEELRQFDVSFGNASISMQKVSKDVGEMRLRQSWSRQQSSGDYYVIKANNDNIQFWSIALCIVVIGCSLGQVAFVHRMFDDSRSSSAGSGRKKLRA